MQPSNDSMRLPLDWRGLALVAAGHIAVLAWVILARPLIDRIPPPPPIFARMVEPEPAVAELPDPVPETTPPDAATAEPPRPSPREPDATPVLAAAAPALPPAAATVPAPTDPAPGPTEVAETIESPPPAPATAAPTGATVDSLPGDPDEVRAYLAAVMRQLNRHKTYPRALKKAKIEGTVIIRFTIGRGGQLLASGVTQGSGHVELDQAAMGMLASATPLPAIPEFMHRDELALAIPVEYSLITDR